MSSIAVIHGNWRKYFRCGFCLILLLTHAFAFMALPVLLARGFAVPPRHGQVPSGDAETQSCNCPCRKRGDGVCRCACCKRQIICTCSFSQSDRQPAFSVPVKDAVLPVARTLFRLSLYGRSNSIPPFSLNSPILKVPKPPPRILISNPVHS